MTERSDRNESPYTPPKDVDAGSPSMLRRILRWRTIPTLIFGLCGLAGVGLGLWATCYFWYTAFAWDAPLIYPDNYKALVRWPLFTALAWVCLSGAFRIWNGHFWKGCFLSIGAYLAARFMFLAIDQVW